MPKGYDLPEYERMNHNGMPNEKKAMNRDIIPHVEITRIIALTV